MALEAFKVASEAVASAVVDIADARSYAERGEVNVAWGLLLQARLTIDQHRAAIEEVADSLAAVSDGVIRHYSSVGVRSYASAHEAICELGSLLLMASSLPDGLSDTELAQLREQRLQKLDDHLALATSDLCAHIRRERAKLLDGHAPAAEPLETLPDDAMMTHVELAKVLKLDAERLRSRLQRWRKEHSDGWQEITEPKPRQPRYLYRISAVRHILREALNGS